MLFLILTLLLISVCTYKQPVENQITKKKGERIRSLLKAVSSTLSNDQRR